MRLLLYPFALAGAWYFWLAGHAAYLVMRAWDHESWVDLWWPTYRFNMLFSCDVQDYVGGEGMFWPWGESA